MSNHTNKELPNDNHLNSDNKNFQTSDVIINKSSEKPPLTSEPSEDTVDPRVQVELEKLNTATDLINKLEIELDDARANFRLLLTESSQRINQMATKLGTCIERGRPYYEARMRAKELQQETQKAALKFERASSAHAAAKEMVRLSEEGLCKEGRTFDPAWQEMLNHATMKVNEAEHERRISKAAHQRMSQAYNAAEQNVQQLHVLLKKSIVKSRPYFEMKAQFNQLLEEQKRKVQSLEENVLRIKTGYSDALHNLEKISDEIHNKRKLRDQASVCDGASNVNSPALSHKVEKTKVVSPMSETRTEGVGSEDPAPPPLQHATCNGNTPEDLNSAAAVNFNSISQNKPFDLPLQKVSLAEMEEMTPLTPGMIFSPYDERLQSPNISSTLDMPNGGTISTKERVLGWRIDELVYNVPKLSQLAKNVADVRSVQENGDLKDSGNNDANTTTLQRASSPGGFYLGAGVGGHSGGGTPLRNPNCDPLKINYREDMLSDSESLASTDTADTLDDHHIECLLLDRVLEQDYQDILASTSDLVSTP